MAGPTKCEVIGCENEPVRSLPGSRVSPYLEISTEGGRRSHAKKRRVHICKDHYREYKKSAKKDRDVERAYWD